MRSLFSVSLCFSAMLLVGCSGFAPSPVGRGYSSYDKEFKSAPGNEARDIGYDYSVESNAAAIDGMRDAVRDLVEKIDGKLSFSVDELYLNTPESNTAFYNSFDHLLREELTRQGYLLSNSDGEDNVRIDFVAKEVVNCEGDDSNSMYLALAIDVVNGVPGDTVGGFYDVPTYGYVRVNKVKVDVPVLCSSETL